MSKLDKDIEILKEFINAVGEEYNVVEENQAIENVLKELEELQDDLSIHEETSFEFQEENIKLRKELETYKKIAEKLAEIMVYLPINEEGTFYDTKEAIIDWARKEVSKTNFDVEEYIENKIKKAEKQKTVFPMD